MKSTFVMTDKKLLPTLAEEWKPWPYQLKSVKFLLEHAAAGLLLDPGMGKTAVTLSAIKILREQGLFRRALVVAPKRVIYRVWPAEQAKWRNFSSLRVAVLHGKLKEAELRRDADVYAINPDGFPWLFSEGRFRELGIDTLVIDEGRRFRRSVTRTFKLLRPFLGSFKRRWLLTGSPTPKNYLDLFGQIYVLDLGNALGPYITHYRFNYFDSTGYMGYDYKLKKEMLVDSKTFLPAKEDTPARRRIVTTGERAVQSRIAPLTLRLDAKDYLKLPKIIDNPIYVDLPDDARKIYNELEQEMITTLEGKQVVTALNAAAASVKCSQVANGGLFFQNDSTGERDWENIHYAKIDALGELIDELSGSPALVAYDFEHDLDRLKEGFPEAIAMGGKLSPAKEAVIEAKWNGGEIEILLGHPASIGHGLNLQYGGCRDVVFHSITWDYELYDQFIKRVSRQGNKSKVVRVHHIIARDTVDEAKMWALRSKRKGQNAFLEALKKYATLRKRRR